MFDQNGQLRDSYDILKDLAAVWPNLTRNQQAEFALAQAGANQTQNFTALMNNFQVAIDATATAMDSAGSAMKENASYMESLEAQTTQLKATFQDFANNVIDKELVSSILTLANDVLGALNTETGKTITQWGLLTGVLTGGIVIYGQIAGKLLSAGSAVISLGKALSAGEATATMFTSAALPLAAALSAIAIAGWEVYKWYKETHKPLQEYTDEIQSNTEQLEQNRDRLAEIEQMSWDKKTPDILDEYDALVKQNDELQRNIDLLEDRRTKQATRQARKGGEVETGGSYYTAVGFDDATQYKTAEDAYLSLASANYLVVESAEDAKKQLEAMGITLQENAEMVKVDADAYNKDLTASMQEYTDQLNSTHNLNQDQLRDYESLKAAVSERVEGLKLLEAQGVTLTESERNLIDAYNNLAFAESVAKNEMVSLNQEGVSALLAKYPQLKSAIEDVNGVSYLNVTALGKVKNATVEDKVAMYDLIAAQTVFNNSSLDVSAKIAQLAALAEQAGATAASIATVMGVSSSDFSRTVKGLVQTKQAKNEQEATQILLKRMYSDMLKTIPTGGGTVEGTPTYPSTTSSTTKTAAKKATDLALEEFKNLQKDLEHQRELGLISEEEYYNKLEQLVKDYKAKATAHMKEYGTDVDTINRNMYQYEEEIYKGRAKLAEDLAEQQKKAAEEAAQAQKEALEQQKSDYETAINYVIKQIDKEIDKLQDLRNQTEQYYDDKIDALNDANDELERQIQYEQLLNNLAQAKDKQLYVFQNGQFQYVQDVEAIASAQAELDAYERDETLRKEVENLETLKDQALASIDEQIEGWEKYKEEWEGVTTQYQEQQDKLLAEQLLGIDAEQQNWETRLANVQSFVDQYNSILSQLNSGAGSFASGGSSGGGSYSSSDDGAWAGIAGGSRNDPDRDEVIKNNTSIGKGRDYLAEAIAAADKGDIDKAYALLDERDKKLDAQGRNSAGGVNKEESRDIINVHLDAYTTTKHANGTISAPGGLSLVGEKGPELRVLNSGDGIIPADATRNLWDWASYNPKDFMSGMSNDNIFHIGNIALPNVTDAKSFVNGLKQLAYQRAYKRA